MATDLLILTIYFICIVYVLYQMALSLKARLEDQVNILLDGEALQRAIAQQLEQQQRKNIQANVISGRKIKHKDGTEKPLPSLLEMIFPLADDKSAIVTFEVSPEGKQTLKPPVQQLSVVIMNDFPNYQVFVDWDSSSIAVYGRAAYRVIRQVPGMPTDLFQPQVYTVANPGQKVNVAVTSEALFKRPDNAASVQSTPMLINLEEIPDMEEPQRVYSLRILVWVKSMTQPDLQPICLLLPFNFHIIEVQQDFPRLWSWFLNPFSPKPKVRSR